MSSLTTSKTVFTNPSAQNYSVEPWGEFSETEILKFHSALLDYKQTPLIPLPSLASSLHLESLYIKDERSRFTVLGISWAIRNALIAELSENLPQPLPQDITISDLASKTKEAQIKLITATDGKLGRIVARLGKYFGVESINTRIFVAGDLDEEVKQEIKREGAEVISVNGDFEMVVREAWLHSVATDGVLVGIDEEENYEDIPRWIVEGYSTLFSEIDSQLPSQPDIIILPVGVGGLAQAATTHYKSSSPTSKTHRTKIVTVEPEAAAALHASLFAGQRTSVEPKPTIVKNLAYGEVTEAAWRVLKDGVDGSTVVSDQEVVEATDELKKQGVDVGACGGAVFAGLKLLGTGGGEGRGRHLGLDAKSTVVLVVTDGALK